MATAAVFISYRRDDCAGYAGRLEDALEQSLGNGRVFRDVRDIVAGEDFAAVINARLAAASVVLVLMGPRWVGVLPNGQRRIDDDTDFVRREVAAALLANTRVVPVLLAGATLPQATTLPACLQALTQHQTLTLNEASWEADVARLITALNIPSPRRWQAKAAVLLMALIIGVTTVALWRRPTATLDTTAVVTAQTTAELVGSWQTTNAINYGWGDRYQERLMFKLFAGELTGTAGFLNYPRTIENLRITGRNIDFVTHSIETVDAQERTLTHHYRAELTGALLTLRMETSGGFSSAPPVEFDAVRIATAP